MKAVISNVIEIAHASREISDWCKSNLIFDNPDYTKKLHMGFYVGKEPKHIKLYQYYIDDDTTVLPVGCYDDIKPLLKDCEVIDYRSQKEAIIKSSMILRDYQEPCLNAMKLHTNGLIIAGCGLGKTNMALQIAYMLQKKTLFITHTSDLVKQAYDRCNENLECTKSLITEGKVDTSGDIVFATVQTLSKNLDKIEPDTFGLVIVDEVHRTATNAKSIGMFRECVEYFSSMYKVGLTATLHRADGLECCIPRLIGNVVYEISEDKDMYVCSIEGRNVLRFDKSKFQVPANVHYYYSNYSLCLKNGEYRDVFDTNGMTINFSKLLSNLCGDVERNNLVLTIAYSTKGSTIILSDRVSQLEYLQQHLESSVIVTGETKKIDREKDLQDVKDGKIKYLLASYKLAKEGLDLPILEHIIMASPVKDEAIVIQSIGRIQRPYKNKDTAHVHDIVDENVSTLYRFYRKRNTIYKKKGWLK